MFVDCGGELAFHSWIQRTLAGVGEVEDDQHTTGFKNVKLEIRLEIEQEPLKKENLEGLIAVQTNNQSLNLKA